MNLISSAAGRRAARLGMLILDAAMLAYAKACTAVVPKVVMTVVGEPVTSPANQEKCRAIAESLGATLRVRPFEGA